MNAVPRPPSGPPPRPKVSQVKDQARERELKAKKKEKVSKTKDKEMKKLRLENEELKRQLIDREQAIMRLKAASLGKKENPEPKKKKEDGAVPPIEGGALPRPMEAEVEKKKGTTFTGLVEIPSPSGSSQDNTNDEVPKSPTRRRPPALQIDVSAGPVDSRPISSLLDGTRTLWRLPYNGKGGAQKRLVYVGLENEEGGGGAVDSLGKKFVEFVSLTDLINGGMGPGFTGGSRKVFQLKSPAVLCWRTPSTGGATDAKQHAGDERELIVTSAHVVRGHATPAFQKLVQKAASPSLVPRPELCFSLVTSARTLDLAAESKAEAEAWTSALQHYLHTLRSWQQGGNQQMGGYASMSPYAAAPPSPYSSPVRQAPHSPLAGDYPPPMPVVPGAQGSPVAAGGGPSYPVPPFQALQGQGGRLLPLPHFLPSPPSPMHAGSNIALAPPVPGPGSPQVRHFFPEASGSAPSPSAGTSMSSLQRKGGHSAPGEKGGAVWKKKLFSSAYGGDVELLASVLEGGAPVDTPLFGEGPKGTGKVPDTPLIICARLGHINCLKLCLEQGASNDPFQEGVTALHAAVSNSQYEAAELLLQMASKTEAGPVVCSLTDAEGATPLHLAAKSGDMRMTDLLLHHGADPCQRTGSPATHGYTALHYAAEEGHDDVVEVLLDYDADLEAIDLVDTSGGNSPLHLAVKASKIECVRLLLQSAANPLVLDNQGVKPLDTAVKRGMTSLGVLLLEYENSLEKPPPLISATEKEKEVDEDEEKEKEKEKEKEEVELGTGASTQEESEEEREDEGLQAALLASLERKEGKEEGKENEPEALENFMLEGEEWAMYLADEEGVSYFYNASTGLSSWEDPRNYFAQPSPQLFPTSKAAAAPKGGMFTEIIEES